MRLNTHRVQQCWDLPVSTKAIGVWRAARISSGGDSAVCNAEPRCWLLSSAPAFSDALLRGSAPPPSFPTPRPRGARSLLHDHILAKSLLQGKSSERHYFVVLSPVFSNINISVAKKKYRFSHCHCCNPVVLKEGRFSPRPRGREMSSDIFGCHHLEWRERRATGF